MSLNPYTLMPNCDHQFLKKPKPRQRYQGFDHETINVNKLCDVHFLHRNSCARMRGTVVRYFQTIKHDGFSLGTRKHLIIPYKPDLSGCKNRFPFHLCALKTSSASIFPLFLCDSKLRIPHETFVSSYQVQLCVYVLKKRKKAEPLS